MVSLDRSAASWKKAIKQDKLNWPWHISDLKWWNSSHAAIYKIESIPDNYFLDPDGKIIAKNLRGKALDNILEKHRLKTKPNKKK